MRRTDAKFHQISLFVYLNEYIKLKINHHIYFEEGVRDHFTNSVQLLHDEV